MSFFAGITMWLMNQQDPPTFSSHGLGSSESMNPSATTFTPTSDFSTSNFPAADPVNVSLARALAEKTAEVYAIKAELENERNRRFETENEVSRINMVNKSLASSIQMLGSIVKHNAQKYSTAPGGPIKQSLPEDKQRSIGPIVEQLPVQSPGAIFHHALEVQQKEHKCEKLSSDSVEAETLDAITSPVRSHRALGSSLARSPIPAESSPVAALGRTLRKHFLASEEAIERRSLSPTANTRSGDARDRELEMSPKSQSSQLSPSRTVVSDPAAHQFSTDPFHSEISLRVPLRLVEKLSTRLRFVVFHILPQKVLI